MIGIGILSFKITHISIACLYYVYHNYDPIPLNNQNLWKIRLGTQKLILKSIQLLQK